MPSTIYDVIIIGGGGSGLATAVSSAQHGCRVLVLEKESRLGGTTGIAVGSFTANRTPHQHRVQIDDSWESHDEDAGRFAPQAIERKNNSGLRRFFLQESATTLKWLSEMGLHFSGPHPEPPNRVHRMHNVIPGAKAYIDTLSSRLRQLGGEILLNTKASQLIEENSIITGVECENHGERNTFHAKKGVVLAAGDYASNPALIGQYKGSEFSHVEGINPNATGDGHLLAHAVGAALVNMEVTYGPELRFVAPTSGIRIVQKMSQWRMPRSLASLMARFTPPWLLRLAAKELLLTWQHPEDSLFEDGAILVNHSGRRFCNELDIPNRELAVAKQEKKEAFIVLDQWLVERYSKWPHFVSTAPEIAYAYVSDYLTRRKDIATTFASLADFSTRTNLSLTHLEASVHALNQDIEHRRADEFGREGDRRKLEGNRWVILGPAKAYFTTTEGGAAINRQFQVLRTDGTPIKGLFAVGQNGLGGQVLWGHGLHIAWAMTSGRLLGQSLGR